MAEVGTVSCGKQNWHMVLETPEVEAREWQPVVRGPDPVRCGTCERSGLTTAIRLPRRPIVFESLDGSISDRFEGDTIELPPGERTIRVATSPALELRTSSSVSIHREGRRYHLRFPDETVVTMVQLGTGRTARESIAIPPTIQGLVATINRFAGKMDRTGPERSHPVNRPSFPTVNVDRSADRPAVPSFSHSLSIRIPDSWEAVYPMAPLAYYLGVPLTISPDRTTPTLTDGDGLEFDIGVDDDLSTAASAWLRRVVFLDTLIRAAIRPGQAHRALRLLTSWDLEPQYLSKASLRERIQSYAEAFDGSVLQTVPDWPLVIGVNPSADSVWMLPYALDRLCPITIPEPEPVTGSAVLEASLEDQFRSSSSCLPLVRTTPQRARSTALAGNRIPLDGFAVPSRSAVATSPGPSRNQVPARIEVVNNAPAIAETPSPAAGWDGWGPGVEVITHEQLTKAELRKRLETPLSHLHIIGHATPEGLHCADGILEGSRIDAVRPLSVGLNTCTSITFGRRLLEAGCRTVTVTGAPVTDGPARTVGQSYLRLLVNGFPIALALQLARRQILMGLDYGVLGDGTLQAGRQRVDTPTVAYVSEQCESTYQVTVVPQSLAPPGVLRTVRFGSENIYRVADASLSRVLTEQEFSKFLADRRDPIVLGDQIHWPTECLDDEASRFVSPL